MCFAVVLHIHRGVARNEVVDTIGQTDHLWGFWKKDRVNGAILKRRNVLIKIQRRGAE